MSKRVHLKNGKYAQIRAGCLTCGKLISKDNKSTLDPTLLTDPSVMNSIGMVLMCKDCYKLHCLEMLSKTLRAMIFCTTVLATILFWKERYAVITLIQDRNDLAA